MSDNYYCQSCGAQVGEQADYCRRCGAPLESPSPTDSESETESQTPEGEDTTSEGLSTGKKAVFIGAFIAGISAFLPWASAEVLGTSVTVQGIDRDGVFSLVFALVAVAVTWFDSGEPWNRWHRVGTIVLGVLISAIGAIYIYDPWFGTELPFEGAREAVQIGVGLYGTLIGGLLIFGGPIFDGAEPGYPKSLGDLSRNQIIMLVIIGVFIGLFIVGLLSGD